MKPGPVRILFLNPSAALGGAEQSLIELLSALPPGRTSPVVLLPAPGPLGEALADLGVRCRVLRPPRAMERLSRRSPLSAYPGALAGALGYLPRLLALIEAEEAGFLWSNGVKFHLLGSLASIASRVPLVAHLRDLGIPPWLARLVGRVAVRVVANSPSTLEAAGLSHRPHTVLPNTLDLAGFRRRLPTRAEARLALRLPDRHRVVLCVGALTEHKGQLRLLAALAPVMRRDPDLLLALVGDSPYRTEGHGDEAEAVRRAAVAAGLSERVLLPGRLAPEGLAPWYAAADLFALRSRSEGFGRACLEAAAAGLPIVTTSLGGTRDLFPDGEAVLLDPDDDPGWERELGGLLDDPSRSGRLGHRARHRAEAFDSRGHPERVAALLRALGVA